MESKYSNINGDKESLVPVFVEMLEEAAQEAGLPLYITSGYRPDTTSEHSLGIAADIRCHDTNTAFRLVKAFIETGFTVIGVYDRHIHVSMAKDREVLFTGLSK